MKILINKATLVIALLCSSNLLFSQGAVENELSTNQVIVTTYRDLQAKSALKTPSVFDTLNLGPKGILDDFSYDGPYPDTSIWMDRNVFINRDFPKAPITQGVATFDGLDETGYPRDFTAGSTSTAVSDFLTSKPINLNYPASDSIYLSFYYQPQGRGNAPEYTDSLVVEFWNPASVIPWNHVWAKRGTTLAINDSSWTLVMIPIKDSAFLKNGFQFRFKNYATLSGNTDHWSVDYVYLNRTRNHNDTAFEDVSFVYNTPSLIKTYSSIPWKQYSTTDMKTDYNETIRNNHTVVKNGSFSYKIYDGAGTQVNTTYSGGSFNIDPYAVSGYMNYTPFSQPPLNYVIPALTTGSLYTIESVINSTPDNDRGNDTIRHTQVFSNSFAYDDGTAENSFGLSTNHAELAEQFTLNVADSLQFIDIFFNPFITNTSIYTFNLKVWTNAGGVPGIAVYTGSTASAPAYGTNYNQFTRYKLDAPFYLTPGIFYVGFEQNTNQFLNVGEDKNTNTQTKIFYNTIGTWQNSPFTGSLMLHPVFGSASEFTGIEDAPSKKISTSFVYPNPANDKLYLKLTDGMVSDKISYSVTDVVGKTVITNTIYDQSIDITALKDGIYFIRLNDGINTATNKFIKVK